MLSSFIYQLERVDPVENQQRAELYRTLDIDAELLAELEPADDDQEVPFVFQEMWSCTVSLEQRDRPEPTITVYRVIP